MQHTKIRTAAAGLLALALIGSGAGAAQAKGGNDREIRKSGRCSAGTVWKLKAKTDDGRLEIELEVDSNRAGADRIVAAANNATTGERCSGALVF